MAEMSEEIKKKRDRWIYYITGSLFIIFAVLAFTIQMSPVYNYFNYSIWATIPYSMTLIFFSILSYAIFSYYNLKIQKYEKNEMRILNIFKRKKSKNKSIWEDASKYWRNYGILSLIPAIAVIFNIILIYILAEEHDGFFWVGFSALTIIFIMLLLISKAKFRKAIQDKNRIHRNLVLKSVINPVNESSVSNFNSIIENILTSDKLKFQRIRSGSDLDDNRIIVAFKMPDLKLELRVRSYGVFDQYDSIFISLGPITSDNKKIIKKLRKSIDEIFTN